jgi:outer membrane protein assembly factor BamB
MVYRRTRRRSFAAALVAATLVWSAHGTARAAPADDARTILDATGTQGGLIVHLGCGDGRLTAALRAGDAYLVHGLDTSAENVARARTHIRSLGVYGSVSVAQLRGKRLPYVDNLVNLLVAEDLGDIAASEVLRVLCPNGVAYVKKAGAWNRTLKPRPDQIDEWTHYLHDATGNAVAHDTVVGPPRRLQWVGTPRWARHHDRMASLSALVSAGGRLFYILDEGSRASVQLPSKWRLVARDAFNGTVLWKREIDRWHPRLWPLKSGPAQPQRRLVAVGGTVYATLRLDAPLTALDAATGRTVRTYEGTFATEEVLASGGVLYVLATDKPVNYDTFSPERVGIGLERDRVARDWSWNRKPRRLMAIEAETGRLIWRTDRVVVPLSLAVAAGRVVFHNGEKIVCLNAADGKDVWGSAVPSSLSSSPNCFAPSTQKYLRDGGAKPSALAASFGATLVLADGVVVFTGGDATMTGLAADSGKVLWTVDCLSSGHYCPEDVLVVGGLVWTAGIAWNRDSGEFIGYDLHSGKVRSRFKPDTDVFFMHQRCYRSKATDRYLIPSRTGTEFIDPKTKHWDINHWVRGGCLYGVMPCNGLLYAPPHSCACYLEAKLNGFNALAPASAKATAGRPAPETPAPNGAGEGDRLQRGPAYGAEISDSRSQISNLKSEISTAGPRTSDGESRRPEGGDWPTYRCGPARSGFTREAVPAKLQRAWQTDVGGRLSSIVVAGGRLFVASVDDQTVHALDARSGAALWRHTVGGRVDSPPTVWNGRVLFGSNDGWVYCLRASDGELIWRFRAAPTDRRLVAFEQVESVWPVPGSVLVIDGVARCVAGRSMFLDGGLRLLQLDPRTGRMLSEQVLDDRDPRTGAGLQTHIVGLNMPVGLPDILSSDGAWMYMRSQQFDMDGNRPDVAPTGLSPASKTGGVHLFSPTGFVDGSWWHRSYWVYGKGFEEGAGGWPKAGRVMPAGHLLVFDDDLVYGYGRQPAYYKWTTPVRYHLFAMGKVPQLAKPPAPKAGAAKRPPQKRRGGLPRVKLDYRWTKDLPMQVRALALAHRTLFVAGPPVVVDEEKVFDSLRDPATRAKLAEQDAALAGRSGALLWAVAAADGTRLAEYQLDAPPAWDGMAAANGRLYLSTADGKVMCLAGHE